MNLVALLIALSMPPANPPQVKDVMAAWTEHASATNSGDVELAIERDSRNRTFGASGLEAERFKVRIRFDENRHQIDVPRLTVVRRDGRTQAAEADPDRARIEFRNVLLEDELKGPQMVPKIEPATRILEAGGREAGQKLSLLDRLVAAAPLWSAQPLRFVDGNKLELHESDASSGWVRVIEKSSTGRGLELWIEARAPYRPVRIIQHAEERPVWQMDLTWSAEESRVATKYFVQTINGSGEALEFVEARLARVEAPLASPADFGIAGPNQDEPPPLDPSAVHMRSLVRRVLDSWWFPFAAIAGCAVVVLFRRRRRPVVN